MKTKKISRAVVADKGKILVLQNKASKPQGDNAWDAGAQRGRWELPGGSVQQDETFRAAVEREIREETGMETEVIRELDRVDVVRNGTRYACQYFLVIAHTKRVTLSDRHMDYRWIPPEHFKDMDWYTFAGYSIPVLENLDLEDLKGL